MIFSTIDTRKDKITQDVTICLGDHFDSKDDLDDDLYNEEVTETIVIESEICSHNELRIVNSKIVCKCGKEWISTPESNDSQASFKAACMAIETYCKTAMFSLQNEIKQAP